MDLVVIQNRQAVTSSLQVADSFEKRHDHILRDIENLKIDVPNFGEMFFVTETPDGYGRPRKTYLMNRKGFTLLAMGFTGKKAIQFKLAYIDAFERMEHQLINLHQPSYAINDPVERAKKWIEEEQQRMQLEMTLKEQQPKVIFADAMQASSTSILVREFSKVLKQNGVDVGERRLYEWLRENGYLIKRKGSDWNTPTQKAMELGLFEIKKTPIHHTSGEISTSKTSKITAKGQAYFINKFLRKDEAV